LTSTNQSAFLVCEFNLIILNLNRQSSLSSAACSGVLYGGAWVNILMCHTTRAKTELSFSSRDLSPGERENVDFVRVLLYAITISRHTSVAIYYYVPCRRGNCKCQRRPYAFPQYFACSGYSQHQKSTEKKWILSDTIAIFSEYTILIR
jgi:hypothetical protein